MRQKCAKTIYREKREQQKRLFFQQQKKEERPRGKGYAYKKEKDDTYGKDSAVMSTLVQDEGAKEKSG